ncbi:hypothetical protein [Streptomyces sp. H27-C3]|uniref:hypothetical protein n=1 Tax=Streptomyces sp. H27-C3 TaxID=3046305 RepID=UPI0024BBD257|nr:hypothetical protein [Streptomyces sp. H27-C3]MDJ0467006.1 hypothetical protein [Streptomyces sp. H27-C3]
MAGLTAAALAAVAFLAYQASANVPANLAAPSSSPSVSASPKEKAPGKDKGKGALAVPAQSGAGVRVIYSLGDKRVWLVGEPGQKPQTFEVMPSTVSPPPGTYRVTSRSGAVTGSDGVQIEHVVRFTNVESVSIGFSSAVDGTMATPNPATKTGGVRMKRADGNAMWSFATVGAKIVVVP